MTKKLILFYIFGFLSLYTMGKAMPVVISNRTYIATNVWFDQSAISEAKCDGYLYIKHRNKFYVLEDFAAGKPINILEFGAKGDGRHDDAPIFQKAARYKRKILVPKTKKFYYFGSRVRLYASIQGVDYPTIKTSPQVNAFVKPKRYKYGRFSAFHVGNYFDVNPIVIEGLHIDGGWNGKHRGTEFEAAISLGAVDNVVIRNNIIENQAGDNITVSFFNLDYEWHKRLYSNNVTIENNVLKNPYRCNIAVISGNNITIRNNTIEKLYDYVCAIDLEPDYTKENAYQIHNCAIYNNKITTQGALAINVYGSSHRGTSGISISNNEIFSKKNAIQLAASHGTIHDVLVEKNAISAEQMIVTRGLHGQTSVKIVGNSGMSGSNTRLGTVSRGHDYIIKDNVFTDNKPYNRATTLPILILFESNNITITNNTWKSASFHTIRFSGNNKSLRLNDNRFSARLNVINFVAKSSVDGLELRNNNLTSETSDAIFVGKSRLRKFNNLENRFNLSRNKQRLRR